jgi:hypothetical protein
MLETEDFVWCVAPGYELVEWPGRRNGRTLLAHSMPSDLQITPQPGRERLRKPLRECRELADEFARSETGEDIANFVRQWGLLDCRRVHLLSAYQAAASRMRGLLCAVDDLGADALPLLSPSVEQFHDGKSVTWVPIDLYNALLWQLQRRVGLEIRRCKGCGGAIFIGARHRGLRAWYCDHVCYMRWRRRARG